MAQTNYAQIITRGAYLSEEFGKELAMRKLECTEEGLEELVGRYVRGKRKGLLRGRITWAKIERGGWVKTGAYDFDAMQAHGFVAPKGISFGYTIVDSWSGETIKTIQSEKYAQYEHFFRCG